MANVDEKGFLMGVPWCTNIVIFRANWPEDLEDKGGSGKATVPQDGNRENITVIDCICADGTVLTPFIIMKAAHPSYSWSKDSLLKKAEFTASPNGCVDAELFLLWMKRVYEPETCVKANSEWRALIFDQHESHLSYETLKFALEHQILCIGLPPKTSGVTQPLDVSCFRPLQQAYGCAVDEETHGSVAIAKQDFAQ